MNVVSFTRQESQWSIREDQQAPNPADIPAKILHGLKTAHLSETLKQQLLQDLLACAGRVLDSRQRVLNTILTQGGEAMGRRRVLPHLRLVESVRQCRARPDQCDEF